MAGGNTTYMWFGLAARASVQDQVYGRYRHVPPNHQTTKPVLRRRALWWPALCWTGTTRLRRRRSSDGGFCFHGAGRGVATKGTGHVSDDMLLNRSFKRSLPSQTSFSPLATSTPERGFSRFRSNPTHSGEPFLRGGVVDLSRPAGLQFPGFDLICWCTAFDVPKSDFILAEEDDKVLTFQVLPSPFLPGILLSRKPPETQENGRFSKRTMVGKNGWNPPNNANHFGSKPKV